MDRTAFTKITSGLLDQIHALHAATGEGIEAIGGSAQSATAEWQLLYQLMRMAGVMADMVGDYAHPRKSALTELVPMVCTSCRTPVTYSGGDPARGNAGGYWTHDDELDEAHCAQWNADGTISAMVAAGATRTPLDTV